MPLRVAIDATSLIGRRTGIGRFAARAIEGLAARPADEIELRAFAVTWRGRSALAQVVPPNVRTGHPPLPARPLHWLWERFDGPRIDAIIGRHDVVHGPNYVVPPGRGARVVSVHDLTAVFYPELCEPHTRRFPTMVRRAVAGGAFVHTDCDAVRAEVIEHFDAPPERVCTVPLGFDPLPPGPAGRGAELAGSPDYIVAVGTIEPRKDYPTLVAAFDRIAGAHPHLRLAIVGAPGWGQVDFDAARRGARHGERIVVLGGVDDGDRNALVREARLLAYPSVYEGFGFPPLEAMSAGVPVVATRVPAVVETVGDAAELVDVGDAEALAAAIERVLCDEARRRELIDAGRRNVDRFDWRAMCDGLYHLYGRAKEAAQ